MDDYHEFGKDYAGEIDACRRHWSPNYLSITQGGVGTSGGASSSVSKGTSRGVGAVTSSGTVSIAGGSMSGDASGVPSFSPIPEFFKRLRKNYQGVKTEKLRNLKEFEGKTIESLWEANTRMRQLISITHGLTKSQAVQYWYRILDRELRRRVRDATLMNDASPTFVHLFEKIELNMVEERVVTSSFARDTITTFRILHSTAQSRPMNGGSGVQTRHPSVAEKSPMALVNCVLSQAMDLNCLTWIVSLGLVEQRRLSVDSVVSTPLVSSFPTGTAVAMPGGDRRDIRHPWSSSDVTRGLARVAAHAGEVSHAEVATKEDTQTPSLKDVA
ncbi:hypothetical protein AXG93_3256s1340 [Marchantia polymorpha subsp. ruderalis]|uniref:Retrotransposon gag domain-containing protein n=1 Tax=Marchantia polymorpha subsp. ruderalis TaxID=1480154 RepID=A0A176VK03_MARPO|nr:hypothetical protein AXG93_3256s1340 [Marchantia polymorpha subsp. ruderalis]